MFFINKILFALAKFEFFICNKSISNLCQTEEVVQNQMYAKFLKISIIYIPHTSCNKNKIIY